MWTNDAEVAHRLQAVSACYRGGRPAMERSLEWQGNELKISRGFPLRSMKTVVECLGRCAEVNVFEDTSLGPIADEADVLLQLEYGVYWDDVNGGTLDAKLTREARELESQWI